MAIGLPTKRAANLEEFIEAKAAGTTLPFLPQLLAHVYIKLDFKSQFENARNDEDARGFFRSVFRAAVAAHRMAEQYGGRLIEVQGSTLHVTLPHAQSATQAGDAHAYAGDVHQAYRLIFDNQRSRVHGWRLTVDAGRTLIVAGRGVHGDDSWVSLGQSANRPAKHLYAQLELSEDERSLKRFWLGVRNSVNGNWFHGELERIPSRLADMNSIAEEARSADPNVTFMETASSWRQVTARALPLAPAGSPESPSPERPQTYFGWVLRADLDGFTARVEECFDDDLRLLKLAEQFYGLMNTAADFTARHKESLAQLPWAGDNFTAAATFQVKLDYDAALPKRLVELALDFEKEMAADAIDSGFGGWAHGIAGGVVHGNAAGNVFLAGIEVDQRRFLVGAGEGFGRSTQAFGDIDPKADQVVIFKPDWERLDESYKKAFEPAVTHRGQQSSLYYSARTSTLLKVRAREAITGAPTVITFRGGQTQSVLPRPHYR